MRILGIDPGLNATGYGVIEFNNESPPSFRLIEAGLIRTNPNNSLAVRLASISDEVRLLLTQHQPDYLAVEDLYSYYKTPQPAILMGHVRGVVLKAAAEAGIPVASYLPTRVKKAVIGKGHAPKEQVARMVQMRLQFESDKIPLDVSDALAVALCHCAQLQMVVKKKR